MPQLERTSFLVLRVWIEPGPDDGLRARIIDERGLPLHGETSVARKSVPEILDVIREWIDDFVAARRD